MAVLRRHAEPHHSLIKIFVAKNPTRFDHSHQVQCRAKAGLTVFSDIIGKALVPIQYLCLG
jgi:hypothetical protein